MKIPDKKKQHKRSFVRKRYNVSIVDPEILLALQKLCQSYEETARSEVPRKKCSNGFEMGTLSRAMIMAILITIELMNKYRLGLEQLHQVVTSKISVDDAIINERVIVEQKECHYMIINRKTNNTIGEIVFTKVNDNISPGISFTVTNSGIDNCLLSEIQQKLLDKMTLSIKINTKPDADLDVKHVVGQDLDKTAPITKRTENVNCSGVDGDLETKTLRVLKFIQEQTSFSKYMHVSELLKSGLSVGDIFQILRILSSANLLQKKENNSNEIGINPDVDIHVLNAMIGGKNEKRHL